MFGLHHVQLAMPRGQEARALVAAGYEPEHDDAFPGFRRFYVHDCFGNRLEFLSPIDAGS